MIKRGYLYPRSWHGETHACHMLRAVTAVCFVGPRMGRMVAQELSLLDSAMVANLALISTTSHCLKDLGLPKGANDTKSADARWAETFHMSFAEEWLNVPDEVTPRVFATNLMLGLGRELDRRGVYVQGAIVQVLGCVRFRMKDKDLRRTAEAVGGGMFRSCGQGRHAGSG
jgi:hypothetical protein